MLTGWLIGMSLAQAAEPAAYALVVGSSRPGPGQQALRYAQADADRMESVLTELGGYDDVDVLRDPSAAELRSALSRADAALRAHAARGEEATFLFYYSGHARSQALNLGAEELPLADLRRQLSSLPASLTLVVLDACQAGALSQVKGVAPAADFSVNSVAGLHTEGMAVIASSTASELSQESESLQGSFFTHHLVSGLRGPADTDGNGQVTLSEAYGYAYHRTLAATAATAVGKQHATLETDLRGRGEMVLTRPLVAASTLVFPREMAAEVLLQHTSSGTVAAEIHKAAGENVRLALLPGGYTATVQQGSARKRCSVAVHPGEQAFTLDSCQKISSASVASKGGETLERWMLELSVGGINDREDTYTERLSEFGFNPGIDFNVVRSASLAWTPRRNLSLVSTLGTLDSDYWRREMESSEGEIEEHAFGWRTRRLTLSARGVLPILSGSIVPYAQAGGGLAWGDTWYVVSEGEMEEEKSRTDEEHRGYHLAAAGGLQWMPSFGGKWRHIGLFGQAEVVYAPVIENLLDDTHDSGGLDIQFGLRGGF